MTSSTQQPNTQKPSPQPGATPDPKSPKQPQQDDSVRKQGQQQPKDKPLDPVQGKDYSGNPKDKSGNQAPPRKL